jgi:DNA-binding HxlR family transcriptional regulator
MNMVHSARTAQLRLAIEIVSDKWRIAVLHRLLGGPLRTWQLRKELEKVSAKVLTQTLRGLERDGLVDRHVCAAVPPRVEYLLTDIAKHLLAALDGLSYWSESYGPETLLARRRYDAKPKSVVSQRLRLSQILGASLKKTYKRSLRYQVNSLR